MKTWWQKVLLLTVLLGWIFACLGRPVHAESAAQVAPRIDLYSLAVEDGEYLYLVGDAVNYSPQLPPGSLDLGGGMLDLWVAKLHRDGTPVFQVLIGGTADETAFGVAVRQGVIYILGETWSDDFPEAPGNAGEDDALVLALAADGSRILWARRFGGSDQDSGRAIVLSGNDIYLTGITWSQDFLPGAWKGDADGFLARLDLSGGLQWIKEFGGRNLDAPFGLAVGSGAIWVTGETFSPNLAGAPLGKGDIFTLRFDTGGMQQFAGLFGGTGEDISYAAALAPDGSLILTGDTQSADLPGALGEYGGGMDSFLMRIGTDGSLQSTSYLGGSGFDSGRALALLPDGDVLVAGSTTSSRFPTGYAKSAASQGGQDAFIAQVNPAGEILAVSLQGGPEDDGARGVGVTTSGIVLAGKFSQGDPPYLRLVPPADFSVTSLPTVAPPMATATLALTATPQPSETPLPTADPLLSATPVQVAIETQPVADTPQVEPSQTQPVSTDTPASAEVQSSATSVPPSADRTAAPVISNSLTPVVLATPAQVVMVSPVSQGQGEGQSFPVVGWVAGGLVLLAALGIGLSRFIRKQ